MTTTPLVSLIEHPGWIREIRLERPEARNAMSTALASDLHEVAHRVARDDGARAVLLTGAGPSFCVGADLKERAGFGADEFMAQRPLFREAFASVRDLPMPTIAVVHGHALGGGYELALSCDVIVADEDCVVGLPEVRVGLVPGGGGTQLLRRRVGPARAASLIFTGTHVAATQAATLGMVDVVAAAGTAHAEALDLAGRISSSSPIAVRAAKRALRAHDAALLDEGLEQEHDAWVQAVHSRDRVEGIAAFVEKRTPHWEA